MKTALIILAAGKGTRMQSDLPKVLHPIAGVPMLAHAMQSGAALEPERVIVVAGHRATDVEAAAKTFSDTAEIVLQEEQNGTAHAVAQATPALKDFTGDVAVLYGDTPFIQPETLCRMTQARKTHDLVMLGFEAADPARYGRLVVAGSELERIVEYKDANEQERKITLCNSGVMIASVENLTALVNKVGNDNASGEFYLTDIVGLAHEQGLTATTVTCPQSETLGINSRAELAAAEAAFQEKARTNALERGVTLTAPETVHFAYDTVLGRDTLVEPNVVFGPGVTVETGAHIKAFSHLEGAHVSRGAVVGPYARLRPGAKLAADTHIGNFVEVKNAVLDAGAKANHLSYIGDAHVGRDTNIGAGTITCNYDGVNKHHTKIGAGVFIGSNTMLVAPVEVGDGAMTASGSVITRNVMPDALAIARGQQINKPGLARKLLDMLRSKKKTNEKAG